MNPEIKALKNMSEPDLYELLTGEADILLTDDYGYLTEECAMLEDGMHAIVNLAKYNDTYIVWVDDECPSFSEEMLFCKCKFFSEYKDAEQYFISLKNTGILPIFEQIEACVNHTSEPKYVEIIRKQHVNIHTYDVYYKGSILIEHMRELDANIINNAIQKYEIFQKRRNTKIRNIEKRINKSTNQNAYVLKYADGSGIIYEIEIHIPSVLQGQERCVVDVIGTLL